MGDNEMRNSSTASYPDLDWSQVRETVRMLQLAVGQIQVAMREGDESIEALSGMFTSMMGSVKQIEKAVSDVTGGEDCDDAAKETIQVNCSHVSEQIHSTIVAFQFYDRLNQRLSHIADSLSSLSELVGDQSRLYSPYEWNGLQEKIRSRYNMREELEMFDAVLAGMDIKDAIRACFDKISERKQAPPEDDIELF